MAIVKQRALSQNIALPISNTIQVQWLNEVLEDGIVIAATLERCAYSQAEKEQYLADVPTGVDAVQSLGW